MASGFFKGARISKGAMYLLFIEVGLSLLYLMSNAEMRGQFENWLVATPENAWLDLKVWTLLTSAFLKVDFVGLIFHGFILWMFVPTLENWWGTKRFLRFALWTSLAGTFMGTLVGLFAGSQAIVGLDPFIYASIIAYGVLYSDQNVQFFGVLPLTGRQLMIGIIGFVTIFIIVQKLWAVGAAYGSAMILAWVLTNGKWTPKLWILRRKQKRLRRHLRIVRDDDDRKKWLN